MGDRVVHLNAVGMTDTQRFGMPSANEHLTRTEHHRKAVVMGVDCLQKMPLPIAIILSSGRWHKTAGMTSYHCRLAIYNKNRGIATGNVQVGQTLYL